MLNSYRLGSVTFKNSAVWWAVPVTQYLGSFLLENGKVVHLKGNAQMLVLSRWGHMKLHKIPQA